MDELLKIPPVTRTILFGTAGVTIPVMLKLLNPYKILLHWPLVRHRYEIWRLISCFLYGGSGIQLLMNTIFLYRTSSELETSLFAGVHGAADYTWSLILIGAGIIAMNYPLQSPILFEPLLMSMTYLNPDSQISLYGLLNLQSKYFPFAMLALSLITAGPQAALVSLTGIISAHIWWTLRGGAGGAAGGGGGGGGGPLRRLLDTPGWLKNAVDLLGRRFEALINSARGNPQGGVAAGGRRLGGSGSATVFTPRAENAWGRAGGAGGSAGATAAGGGGTAAGGGGGAGGSTTSVLGGGYNWGRGQRLGE